MEWKFPKAVGNLSLLGYSRAADATSLAISELSVQLDAGDVVGSPRPESVFVSHTHTDHIHHLTHFVSRNRPPNFYVPIHAVGLVENYLRSAQEMSNNAPFEKDSDYTLNHHLIGVQPGDVLTMKRGQLRYEVRVFECFHSVPTVGYAFSAIRQKLKPEFQKLPGKEIAALRKTQNVTEDVKKPLFSFAGDTTPEVFAANKFLFDYPVIITECSFLTPDEESNAKRTKHTAWTGDNGLEKVITSHPENTFVLTHFSHRYKNKEILAHFEECNLANIVPLVAPPKYAKSSG
eukprot:m.20213 g.20213  ORF g.20213 m.20213 type:complete len:290 (-) comp12427_c0_seq2:119-988(-)